MPFMDAYRPSIQIGLLEATADQAGFPVRTRHANLDFAVRVGLEHYRGLAEHRGRMLGDWLFAVEAFGKAAPDTDDAFLDDFTADLAHLGGSPGEIRDRLRRVRHDDVPAYLDA